MTITGTNFGAATAVFFGSVAATSFTIVSDTVITATLPVNLRVGAVSTSVVTHGATSATTVADVLNVTMAPITLSPGTLPSGDVGAAYTGQISADGGTAPYTYAVEAGALPAGVTLDAVSGSLTGRPTTGGASSFTVSAQDQYGNRMSADYTLIVVAPVPTVSPEPTVAAAAPAARRLAQSGAAADGAVPVAAIVLLLAGLALSGFGYARRRRHESM